MHCYVAGGLPVKFGPKRPFLNFRQDPLLLVAQKTPAGQGQNAFAMAKTQAQAVKDGNTAFSKFLTKDCHALDKMF